MSNRKSFLKNSAGAALIEFALVLPLFLLLLMGIIEFGLIRYSQSALSAAVTSSISKADFKNTGKLTPAMITSELSPVASIILSNGSSYSIKDEVIPGVSVGGTHIYRVAYVWRIFTPFLHSFFENGAANLNVSVTYYSNRL